MRPHNLLIESRKRIECRDHPHIGCFIKTNTIMLYFNFFNLVGRDAFNCTLVVSTFLVMIWNVENIALSAFNYSRQFLGEIPSLNSKSGSEDVKCFIKRH